MNICERKVFFFFKYIIITFVINQDKYLHQERGINQFSVSEIRPFYKHIFQTLIHTFGAYDFCT